MDWNNLLSSKRKDMKKESYINKDIRTEFEKDYHTIIGSASFRRLQDKTQAFPLDSDDFIRTRLTHSLEVSSIAKSLGESIYRKIKDLNLEPYFNNHSSKELCDILLCAGLIHDIGNPPFGHFGENAIRDWFKNNLNKITYKNNIISEYLDEQMLNDLYFFEGNAQALRIIVKHPFLGNLNGMNLTYAVLNSIIKYPVSSKDINKDKDDIKYKKIGYFYSEKDLYCEICENTGTFSVRHPLTYLLEAADDIGYKTSDIEDAFIKNIISYEQFIKALYLYIEKYPCREEYRKEYLKFINHLELIYKKYSNVQHGLNAVQMWSAEIQSLLISYATQGFCSHYNKIMKGEYKKDLFYNTLGEYIVNSLAFVTEEYIFKYKSKIKIEFAGTMIIQFLLDKFIKSAIYFDTDLNDSLINEKVITILSAYYKDSYYYYSSGKDEKEKLYLRLLMVTDFVSGMTDRYAKMMFQEMNGII